ncbi:helix-turn-helix domain-containing protein [Microbacterium sediminis]|uniref:Uncharacterized protein n=1 Tax=Microbacterium sediminis TaxID=904291 RepID=A0A1B9NAF0_9MICO|nr:helix-turn-helix domain-containing protein [Microbacterium sediminis]OCG73575.1 hypothetical protein A7J15_07845 [Microbacterium sediminis]QBR73253.1 DUF2690 domain-containing protein [Microbacterium sediminis]
MTMPGPDADSLAVLAADLRALRLRAGSPTLTRLQADSGISKSGISDALNGKALPSARTLDGIVRALGAEPAEWLARRDVLARAGVAPAAATAPTEAVEPRTRRRIGLGTAVVMSIASLIVGAGGSAAATYAIVTSIPAEQAPRIAVATGSEPALTPCVDDAAVATAATGPENSLLEIVWSDKCQAGWGRITRFDEKFAGNTVTVAIYPQTAPDGPDRQEVTEHDVQGGYTTLVVRPTPDTLLCAEGSYTVGEEDVVIGEICI